MKVILLQNIKGIGTKGDICEVSDGYAQNSLLPKKMVKAATASELNKINLAKESHENKQEKVRNHTKKVLELLDGKVMTVKEKLNEKGSLYHALGVKDIAKAIHKEFKVSVDKKLFAENYAIKDSGDYQIVLKDSDQDITVTLLLTISAK